MNEDEIYNNIKYNYLKLDKNIQKLYEDYFKIFNYWGSLSAENSDFNEIEKKAKFLSKNVNNIKWLYEELCDYRSKLILYAIIKNWYCYDFNNLRKSKEIAYSHYFDLDLIKVNKDTVYVDLGSYIGDNIIDFINCYNGTYKKIYGYDITDLTYSLLKNNVSKYDNIVLNKKAVGEKRDKVLMSEHEDLSSNKVDNVGNLLIDQVSLDEDITEEISLVKMDIEGSELNALKGMERHIKNEMPDLLISIYHKNEDLIDIPKLIKGFNSNYKLFLRSYSGEVYPTEIVLFCVKE